MTPQLCYQFVVVSSDIFLLILRHLSLYPQFLKLLEVFVPHVCQVYKVSILLLLF